MTAPSVEVRDLVIEYDSGGYKVRPIDGFSLEADAGELIVLLGPSGCGKTSILSVLGGILKPTGGTVRVGDVQVERLEGAALADYRQRTVGFVFQAFNLIPSLNARENVAIPLIMAGVGRKPAPAPGRRAAAPRRHVASAGRTSPGRCPAARCSACAIARGLAADPPVLLADEPTANLDYIQAEGVIIDAARAAGRRPLIVISTHDDRLVPIADRVVHLAPDFRERRGRSPHGGARRRRGRLRAGHRGELVYVIEEGTRRDRAPARRRHRGGAGRGRCAGKYFGELGPLLGFPRSATARAITPCGARPTTSRDFREQVLERHRRRQRRLSPTRSRWRRSLSSLAIWWRALTRRTVPDLERMTSDWVVAPRPS